MYSENDETFIEKMTEDISAAARLLALGTEKEVPKAGLFPKITVEFKDKSGKLDITYWKLSICSISIDGGNENKRYLEVSGTLRNGYEVSCFIFAGTTSECIEQLRNTSYVKRVKQTIRLNLKAMDD